MTAAGKFLYLEPREFLDKAIIAQYRGRNVYELHKLIKQYAAHLLARTPELGADAYEDAAEIVDYKIIPSISYMGEFAPCVVASIDEIEEGELEGDPEVVVIHGKLWEVLC